MWSATCCSVAFGARARHAFTESAIAAESVPAARRARARGSRLSSYTRTASETKAGLKFTMTMPPFAGTSRRIESGTSREWCASARGRVREHDGGPRGVERIGHRAVVHVREVHEDPDPIHLADDVSAECREAAPRRVGGRGRPRETAPVRERDVADAEGREHPERAEGILDGVPTLDADQARDLPGPEVALHVRGAVGHREVARIPGAQPLDQVDLLEGVHGRVRPGIHRGDRHVRRPELATHRPGAKLRDVGHQVRLAHREVDRIEPAPLADRVGDVVVAVDEGNGAKDGNGSGAIRVALRRKATERRKDRRCQQHQHQHQPPHPPSVVPSFRRLSHVRSVAPVWAESWRRPARLSRLRLGTMPDTKAKIALELNGEPVEVAFAPHKTLLEVLREDLGLTGTKHGCELGECGTCTVLVDGVPVLSCLVLGLACAGRRVKTVEGMAEGGKLHPLQHAFAELGAAQCGYCTPAFLLAAEALLAANPRPTRDDIKQALAGNLCRCTGYIKIYEAVEWAAAQLRGEDAQPAREVLYGHP